MSRCAEDWFDEAWNAAFEEGRCPICATGNSHTASRCTDAVTAMLGLAAELGHDTTEPKVWAAIISQLDGVGHAAN